MTKKSIIYILIPMLFLASSCDDSFLETPVRNGIPAEEALKTAEDMQFLLNGIYDVTANYMNGRGQVIAETLGDNIYVINNDDLNQVYQRKTDIFNGTTNGYYLEVYRAVARANTILDNLDIIELSASEKQRFEGEAKFLRALGHWSIARLYSHTPGFTADNSHGGIVLRKESGFSLINRPTVQETYDFIIQDLKDAETLLPTSNGVYATSWAAKGFLAKVYFQMNDFVNANAYASEVLNDGPFAFDDNGIANRFSLQRSSENVFMTVSTVIDGGTQDNRAKVFSDNYRSDIETDPALRIRNPFYLEVSARENDARLAWFTIKNEGEENEYYALGKFDYSFADVPIIHVTDLMLIRAISIASDGNLSGNVAQAITDINTIRARAGVSLLSTGASNAEVLAAAYLERRIELVGEGDRAFELTRRGAIGENILIRGAAWNCPGMAIQFPTTDLHAGFPRNEEGGCE